MLTNAGHAGQSSVLAASRVERLSRRAASNWEHPLAANILHASCCWYAAQLRKTAERARCASGKMLVTRDAPLG
eukprot:15444679-Alexandrium_andersonii.AAC.1